MDFPFEVFEVISIFLTDQEITRWMTTCHYNDRMGRSKDLWTNRFKRNHQNEKFSCRNYRHYINLIGRPLIEFKDSLLNRDGPIILWLFRHHELKLDTSEMRKIIYTRKYKSKKPEKFLKTLQPDLSLCDCILNPTINLRIYSLTVPKQSFESMLHNYSLVITEALVKQNYQSIDFLQLSRKSYSVEDSLCVFQIYQRNQLPIPLNEVFNYVSLTWWSQSFYHFHQILTNYLIEEKDVWSHLEGQHRSCEYDRIKVKYNDYLTRVTNYYETHGNSYQDLIPSSEFSTLALNF